MRSREGIKSTNRHLSTTWDHLVHGRWGIDDDNFYMNQFLHPYQGLVFHGIARSNGLNFWESSAYAVAGSFLWELAGETMPPSVNDLIASGIGGSFFGEPLFRMANLLLENSEGKPGFWRELGRRCSRRPSVSTVSSSASAISPCFQATIPPPFCA